MNMASTIGGLAGACALTLVNEGVRQVDKQAPRLDLLGQNALARLVSGNNMMTKTTQKVFPLAGDLVSNTLYYAMARGENSKSTLLRGALLGIGAGIGALALPGFLGLPEQHTSRTAKTQVMTVAWYLIGGLVAAAVINALDNKKIPANNELKSAAINAGKQMTRDVRKTMTRDLIG